MSDDDYRNKLEKLSVLVEDSENLLKNKGELTKLVGDIHDECTLIFPYFS